MALTKEELDNIKLPLSDKDYWMLREEDARSGYKIWSLASSELREAFDKKEAELLNNNKGCLFNWLPWNRHWNGIDDIMGDVPAPLS